MIADDREDPPVPVTQPLGRDDATPSTASARPERTWHARDERERDEDAHLTGMSSGDDRR